MGITGTTYVDISGYTRFGEAKEEPLSTQNYEFSDNVTWIHGRHRFIDGRGLLTLDVGLFKEFAVTERWRIRLQSQVRNLPNHPNFANPEMNLSSGNFNKIRSLVGNASTRVIVVGVRIIF
jgi:hypothetical protein